MDLLTSVFTYFLVWWVMLFTVLPLKIEHHKETPKGEMPGAPINANMVYKLKLNAVLSAGIFLIIFVIAEIYGENIQAYFRGDV